MPTHHHETKLAACEEIAIAPPTQPKKTTPLPASRKLSANLAANLYSQCVTVAIQILTVPFYLAYWTPEKYGEWLVITSIPAILSLSDGGVTNVAVNRIVQIHSTGNLTQLAATYHASKATVGKTWTFAFASVLSFVFLGNYLNCFSLALLRSSIVPVVSIFATSILVEFYVGILFGLLRAGDKNAFGVFATSSLRLSNVVGPLVALPLGSGPIGVALAILLPRIAGAILIRKYVHSIYPGLSETVKTHDIQSEKSIIWSLGWKAMLFPAGNAIFFQGLTLMVNAFLGPASVTLFNVSRTVTRSVTQISLVIKHAFAPSLAKLLTLPQKRPAKLEFLRMQAWVSGTTIAIGILVFFFRNQIFNIITSGSVTPPLMLFSILLLSAVINALWNSGASVMQLQNRHREISIPYFAVCVTTLAFAYAGYNRLGINAFATAMALGDITMLSIIARNLRKWSTERETIA